MITYALTGGIGAGKSVVALHLTQLGIPVVDTDVLARAVVEPGQPALALIEREFGPAVLQSDGSLNRSALARVVFREPEARRRLEAIVHPPIREAWTRQIECWRLEQRPCAVVVIPLLFEIGAEAEFDHTVCVACDVPTQCRRLLARGWDEAEIERRLGAQLPLAEKMRRAEYVLWNNSGLNLLEAQAVRVFRCR